MRFECERDLFKPGVDCNEVVFAVKKENNYVFLTIYKVKILDLKKLNWTWIEL